MRSAALGLLVWLLGLSAWAQTFPPLTGRVVDRANVISAATEAQLTARLADLETKTGAQVVVATVPSLEDHPIEDYGYRLGRAWKIGQAGKNNGVVFLVAPNERRVTIEVGYGLEPVLTDTLSFLILQQRVLPRFREGKMEEGIVAGVNAVIEQIALDPEQARERVAAAESAQRRSQSEGEPGIGGFLLLMFFFFFILPMLFRGRGRRRRRGLGGAVTNAILWSAVANSGRHRRGGWGGGGGFGGGGGGFRGGGGSFGGGGASGGW